MANKRENVFLPTSKLQSTSKPLDAEKRGELDPDYSAICVATINTENIYAEAAAMSTLQKSNKNKRVQKGKKMMYLLTIFLSIVMMLILGCFVALFLEVATLKSKTASLQLTPPSEQASSDSNIMFQIINQSLADLESRLGGLTQIAFRLINELDMKYQELSNQLNTSITQQLQLESTVANNTQKYQELSNRLNTSITQQLQLESTIANHTHMFLIPCAALPPSSPSGYYLVRASNGSVVRVYCDMTRSCGGVTGGWTRVANLNFADTSSPCPDSLTERTDSTIRTCGIGSISANCAPVIFETHGIPYSRVCGKVLAYQYGSTDAFGNDRSNQTVDSNYVDGVSLTHGNDPRQHIWTFAAAVDEFGAVSDGRNVCECSHSTRSGTPAPQFVGQDYFCDSGVAREFRTNFIFFSASPLWDGAGCGPDSTCCSFNNPPWFYKELPSPTSDAIEMRVCSDEVRSREDVAMSSVEIYIQ